MSGDDIRARFLNGSYHVAIDEVQPCGFIPGERVVVDWPWWGPWTCSVIAYEADRQRVKLSDGWGSTKTFPISELWLPKPKSPVGSRRRVYLTLIGAGAGLGALVGSILTALLLG